VNKFFLPERWEQGAFFPWTLLPSEENDRTPWGKNGQLWGSGRDALRALINYGKLEKDWRRLWIPSYFCREVVASLLECGLELRIYFDSPLTSLRSLSFDILQKGDVILLVNYFGLRLPYPSSAYQGEGIVVVEDHTHDPWSAWAFSSRADWCIASLRKTLPIPDGGVLWSPTGQILPKLVKATTAHRKSSMEMLTAMVLKGRFLEGHDVKKELFLNMAARSENIVGSGRISGATEWTTGLLAKMPVLKWREIRKKNYNAFRDTLESVPWVTVLKPEDEAHCCPYSGVLLFDSPARRDKVRMGLIDLRIYPSILWPQESPLIPGIPAENLELERKLLSIHCDMRSNTNDMKRIGALIRKIGAL